MKVMGVGNLTLLKAPNYEALLGGDFSALSSICMYVSRMYVEKYTLCTVYSYISLCIISSFFTEHFTIEFLVYETIKMEKKCTYSKYSLGEFAQPPLNY